MGIFDNNNTKYSYLYFTYNEVRKCLKSSTQTKVFRCSKVLTV